MRDGRYWLVLALRSSLKRRRKHQCNVLAPVVWQGQTFK